MRAGHDDTSDDGILWASGPSGSVGLRSAPALAAFAATLPATPFSAAARPDDVRAREADAVLGRATGPVQGLYQDEAWAVVAHERDAPLLDALAPLRRRRGCPPANALLVGPGRGAPTFDEVEAIVIAGCSLPWSFQLELQARGLLVGRVPFTDPAALERWAERVAEGERSRAPLPGRAVWVVAPACDGFTRRLRRNVLTALLREAERNGLTTLVGDEGDAGASRNQVSVVVLLTHGAPGHPAGEPRDISQRTREAVRERCRAGAFVVHLGCDGAGRSVDDPTAAIVASLGGAPSAPPPRDAFDSFALDCLAAGAPGVIAHVGPTWSNAFDNGADIARALSHIFSGASTLGVAHEQLMHLSLREARGAISIRDARGNAAQVGDRWLRSLDVARFALIGDPSICRSWP